MNRSGHKVTVFTLDKTIYGAILVCTLLCLKVQVLIA